jgi:hypothetical protein
MSTTGLRRAENQEIIPTEITTIGGQPRKPAFRPGAFEADGSGWRYDKTTDPTICIILITSNLI